MQYFYDAFTVMKSMIVLNHGHCGCEGRKMVDNCIIGDWRF